MCQQTTTALTTEQLKKGQNPFFSAQFFPSQFVSAHCVSIYHLLCKIDGYHFLKVLKKVFVLESKLIVLKVCRPFSTENYSFNDMYLVKCWNLGFTIVCNMGDSEDMNITTLNILTWPQSLLMVKLESLFSIMYKYKSIPKALKILELCSKIGQKREQKQLWRLHLTWWNLILQNKPERGIADAMRKSMTLILHPFRIILSIYLFHFYSYSFSYAYISMCVCGCVWEENC